MVPTYSEPLGNYWETSDTLSEVGMGSTLFTNASREKDTYVSTQQLTHLLHVSKKECKVTLLFYCTVLYTINITTLVYPRKETETNFRKKNYHFMNRKLQKFKVRNQARFISYQDR
jgi:hypothetical protein